MRSLTHRLFGLLLAAIAAALVVSSCSAPEEDVADASARVPTPEAGAIPVTVQQAYAPAIVEKAPTRIAALGVGDGDTLLALGVMPTTIAPFADPDQATAPWNAELIGDAKPVVLSNSSAALGDEIPKALATSPDLITAVGADPTRDQFDLLSKTAPTILRQARFEPWQVPWDAQTIQIGTAIGQPDLARRKVGETEVFLAGIRAKNPQFAGKTAVVVTSSPTGGVSVYGPEDGRAQTVAGYGLVFPPVLRDAITSGFYGELPAESLDRLDSADIVIAVDWEGSNDKLRSNPAFTRLEVARSGRVVYLPQEVGSAMSVPTLLTIPWVADQAVGPIAAAASAR
ncbi:ABC transporter substrate-binding protein [Gordonia amicalis]|uniref:ABC transporter substrate-binding protein n=1 Tax=Gordonia amicalis TaxID=89053 RepID=UPI0002A62FD5|nr:ABC transporter substrate-binding protein [Gordonia amicalis]MBA5847285.1 ABC transporter substrate-binding protein [Gordonia amicalis]MDV7174519.1 ABC transporter substrate-binding protein [Gordonia amicalis]NKX78475.1 ABC transporter substrate-binding protein [Gordonia amicalis]UOG23153.1 ABC transporter substrate-binding protein [Gordonia amicalis]GAC54724.1 putative ABC transporter substrate-binding protein [Gordonia amicalis NBRC 100051 = JCM 11271]